ncbi:MAG: hypothetical protein IKM97_04230 [Clostridia bacterium]|nr:hypothetical protein [Clostridia bacterium]
MLENKRKPTDTIEFYIGVLLLGAGLFFLLNKTMIYSGFYSWRIGGFSLSSGLVILPLFIGIIWLFYNPKSFIAKLISLLGGVFILASIILGIHISFTKTTLFDFIIMIILLGAGIGLILRTFFYKKGE